MFGFSFGELMVLLLVGLIVIGPKELPKLLRKAGQWAGKLRRFALDMRQQSGIDEALRSEGLDRDIAEIRKLARGEIDHVVSATRMPRLDDHAYTAPAAPADDPNAIFIDREREFPREGPDACGALPDTAIVYAESFPSSRHADDPIYTAGIAAPAAPVHPGHEDEHETAAEAVAETETETANNSTTESDSEKPTGTAA